MIKFIYKDDKGTKAETTVTLPYEKRIKSRLKVILDNGKEAAFFLERGTVLNSSDRLCSEDGYTVEVVCANEPVTTAYAQNQMDLCRACYHLGNRHVPLQIGDTWVRYLNDHVLDRMVEHLGLKVTAQTLPFDPESGAWGHHHHDDGH